MQRLPPLRTLTLPCLTTPCPLPPHTGTSHPGNLNQEKNWQPSMGTAVQQTHPAGPLLQSQALTDGLAPVKNPRWAEGVGTRSPATSSSSQRIQSPVLSPRRPSQVSPGRALFLFPLGKPLYSVLSPPLHSLLDWKLPEDKAGPDASLG